MVKLRAISVFIQRFSLRDTLATIAATTLHAAAVREPTLLFVTERGLGHTMPRKKHESTLLHTYVLNEFLTADPTCSKQYFCKNSL